MGPDLQECFSPNTLQLFDVCELAEAFIWSSLKLADFREIQACLKTNPHPPGGPPYMKVGGTVFQPAERQMGHAF